MNPRIGYAQLMIFFEPGGWGIFDNFFFESTNLVKLPTALRLTRQATQKENKCQFMHDEANLKYENDS